MTNLLDIKLFFAPGTCARVTLIALEEVGKPFTTQVVKFLSGDHRSPEFLQLNPHGKVPVLIVNGAPLDQNVAILTFLARTFPDARLLPTPADPMMEARILADLVWCASGLHPIVTRMRMPQFICDEPRGASRVREMASQAMAANFELIETRLGDRDWWLSDWSVLDAYLYWVWFRATGAGLNGSAYPRYAAHAARMAERPSVQRALQREASAEAHLESLGLAIVFPEPGQDQQSS